MSGKRRIYMWTAILVSGALCGAMLVYLLSRAYLEADQDFHPESHAHRGSI